MRISVFGLGYVGCVSAACLARDEHDVVGVDVNAKKVQSLNSGRSPIVEPGLDTLISTSVKAGRLIATQDGSEAIRTSDVTLITVGTPSNRNGSLDLQYIERVSQEIGKVLKTKDTYHTIIERSTVLPGTVVKTVIPLLEQYSGKRAGVDFGVVMNPEFLREGSAITDYDKPGQIVIGQFDTPSGDVVSELYQSIDAPEVRTSIETAEMVKYVYNAFHAVKIAFANEVGNFCKAHEIDGREVMDIFCRDRELNISSAYLRPGFAFGGSCLPKDTRALNYRAKERDVEMPLFSSILQSNSRQIERGIEMIERTGRAKIGVLGLSFKAGTDDVRESPTVPLIETLVGRGYNVRVYDETIELGALVGANKSFLENEIPHISSLMLPSVEEVLTHAEVIVLTPAYGKGPPPVSDEQILIDLNGNAKTNGTMRGVYDGICW